MESSTMVTTCAVGLLLATVLSGVQGHGGHFSIDLDKEPENALHNADFVADAKHLQEHMDEGAKVDLDNASPEELAFYFFHFHDKDKDNCLDGIELLTALRHGMQGAISKVKENTLEDHLGFVMDKFRNHMTLTVDRILEETDSNGDGYLTYLEYSKSQRTSLVVTQASRHIF